MSAATTHYSGEANRDLVSRAEISMLPHRTRAKKIESLRRRGRYAGRAITGGHSGYLYVLVHPAMPGYAKVGRAVSPKERLKTFQTGCPTHSYALALIVRSPNCVSAELEAHAALAEYTACGEWFKASLSHICEVVERIAVNQPTPTN